MREIRFGRLAQFDNSTESKEDSIDSAGNELIQPFIYGICHYFNAFETATQQLIFVSRYITTTCRVRHRVCEIGITKDRRVKAKVAQKPSVQETQTGHN